MTSFASLEHPNSSFSFSAGQMSYIEEPQVLQRRLDESVVRSNSSVARPTGENDSPAMSLYTVALGSPTSSSPPSRSDMMVHGLMYL